MGSAMFISSRETTLYRFNVSAGTFRRVDAGLAGIRQRRQPLVGAQPVADLPDGGRVRVYLAADLAKLRGELRTLQRTLAMMTGPGRPKDPETVI